MRPWRLVLCIFLLVGAVVTVQLAAAWACSPTDAPPCGEGDYWTKPSDRQLYRCEQGQWVKWTYSPYPHCPQEGTGDPIVDPTQPPLWYDWDGSVWKCNFKTGKWEKQAVRWYPTPSDENYCEECPPGSGHPMSGVCGW